MSVSTRLQRFHHSLFFLPVLIILFEELANRKGGPKGEPYNELLELCTHWLAVPASYELRDVVKHGVRAQRVSRVTEIWKGMYFGEVVALKSVRLSQDDPGVKEAHQVSVS